jgi:peroxiredoxin
MKATRRQLIALSAGVAATMGTAGLVMARKEDTTLPLNPGDQVPAIEVTDATGKRRSLAEFRGKTVVLEWTSPSCPFVRAHYEGGTMQALQRWALERGVAWLSVLSTHPSRGDYLAAADALKFNQRRGASPTALLMDDGGELGRKFGARTTPHMFVIDAAGRLAYAGAIDDRPTFTLSKTGGADAKNHVKAALEDLLAGRKAATVRTRPYGCAVGYQG